MVDVSDPAIVEAYKEIRKNGSATNWMTLDYETPKRIKFCAKGEGGIDEMVASLPEDQVRYGYARVEFTHSGDELTKRVKFVFFSWGPPRAPALRKGNMSVHLPAVKEVLRDSSISLQASVPEEISADVIREKLDRSNY
ncbi:actin binding protein [Pelomyxa schiedti]|nr:actin binding protein [Pelomyxa schiedti]